MTLTTYPYRALDPVRIGHDTLGGTTHTMLAPATLRSGRLGIALERRHGCSQTDQLQPYNELVPKVARIGSAKPRRWQNLTPTAS